MPFPWTTAAEAVHHLAAVTLAEVGLVRESRWWTGRGQFTGADPDDVFKIEAVGLPGGETRTQGRHFGDGRAAALRG